jgi:hypothetical protein
MLCHKDADAQAISALIVSLRRTPAVGPLQPAARTAAARSDEALAEEVGQHAAAAEGASARQPSSSRQITMESRPALDLNELPDDASS